ncbi:uncharacterized protein LOC134261754 [Saccostrea cucullata]|uniref:uncharacterized protein LOC134261754 n=1 Tax=Saccostrea cuccullata TaxID=36930 RepID=UPI002ED545B3
MFVMEQIEGSGQLYGYKLLHLKCIKNGFVVNQETIRFLLQIVDQDGVETRQRNRLQRRNYFGCGPDFTWHVDSYDKLKPYGFCINGCIDGFSRKIIWLEVYTSNNNPNLIASYYVNAVKCRQGCPKRLRLDRGTENSSIAQMEMFFRYEDDDDDLTNCVIFGSSNHNQRIESWWGYFRKHCGQYWMNTFQKLRDEGNFTCDFVDKSILQFCFMQTIQDEINEVVEIWNTHRIRPYRNQISPSGRPNIMYNLPHLYGAQSHLCRVTEEQIAVCESECTPKTDFPCDETVFELCCFLMEEAGYDTHVLQDTNEKEQLYIFLRDAVRLQLRL